MENPTEEQLSKIPLTEEQVALINLIFALQDHYYDRMDFSTGGPLHIVLDDYNLEDSHILYCKKICEEIRDPFGMLLADALLKLPIELRESVMNNQWYFRKVTEDYVTKLHRRLDEHYQLERQKPLKTLEAANDAAFVASNITSLCGPVANGIACPECGQELMDSSPCIVLTSHPAQVHTHCSKCTYKGTRYI